MPLYSVQNRFYKQVQKGALNGNGKQQQQKRTTTEKAKAKRETAPYFMPFVLVQEEVLVA